MLYLIGHASGLLDVALRVGRTSHRSSLTFPELDNIPCSTSFRLLTSFFHVSGARL
jgi:hypothetical protein